MSSALRQAAIALRSAFGFAGSAADSFALFGRFESKLEQYRGNLERSAVELAKEWRTDRALRRLEAMLIVLDAQSMFLLSGTGDLIEPDEGVVGIGSGGAFAQAAAEHGIDAAPDLNAAFRIPGMFAAAPDAEPQEGPRWRIKAESLSPFRAWGRSPMSRSATSSISTPQFALPTTAPAAR